MLHVPSPLLFIHFEQSLSVFSNQHSFTSYFVHSVAIIITSSISRSNILRIRFIWYPLFIWHTFMITTTQQEQKIRPSINKQSDDHWQSATSDVLDLAGRTSNIREEGCFVEGERMILSYLIIEDHSLFWFILDFVVLVPQCLDRFLLLDPFWTLNLFITFIVT